MILNMRLTGQHNRFGLEVVCRRRSLLNMQQTKKGKETTFSVVGFNLPQMAEEMMIIIRFNSSVENIVCLICKNWFGIALKKFFILIIAGFKGERVKPKSSESGFSQPKVG